MTDLGSTSSLAMKVADSNSNSPGTADAPSLTIMAAVIPILLSLGYAKDVA